MRFSYPLGLLGLIAIPILILIYIIKNKYTEKTIASTYLWTLSERFLKRRLPISKLAGLISLILQILAVVFLSLAIAHPIIIIPDAANDYCFILDASGSMNITQNGKTRFELGKEQIRSLISDSMSGSTYTLIYAGHSADTVLKGSTDKARALEILDTLEPGYEASTFSSALERAQGYFDENPALVTYLVTDKQYLAMENLTVVSLTTEGDNYGISELSYTYVGDTVTVKGFASSYVNDTTVTVELYINGAEEPSATQEVATVALVPTEFEFVCEGVDGFRYAEVKLLGSDILAEDDVASVYNVSYENSSKTLLVSDSPAYLGFALRASKKTQLETVTTKGYEDPSNAETIKGHDLIIFDSYTPEELPSEGAVWLVNPVRNLAGTNFNYQGNGIKPVGTATYSSSTATQTRKMLEGVTRNGFELAQYVKCGLGGKFSTLIECDGNPILFAGANTYGNREVVFAFDLHDSAPFTLSLDYATLVSNLLDYSFPAVIEDTYYYCGDLMQINMIVGSSSVKITTPSGQEVYPDMSASVSEYELTEIGSYVITMMMNDKTERTFNVYSAMPEEERYPFVQEEFCMLQGTPDNRRSDGTYDSLLIMFILLAVLAVADYGVYCYEQYQLR